MKYYKLARDEKMIDERVRAEIDPRLEETSIADDVVTSFLR
jgi:hypothetical protein